jgi:ABC-type nitrate/sulfonate/bicarbonate transport system substrate-binding protein
MPAVSRIRSTAAARPLRLGFVALSDAAPLAVAQEHGYFAAHGLQVKLTREIGWATVRDKLLFGELDAAPAPAPLLWAASLGLDCAAVPVCTAFVVNLHGNALTLSNRLWAAGARDAPSLAALARSRRGEARLTFGIVSSFSSHHLLLRRWLAAAGLDPVRDVRLAVVPPAQMFRNLAAGTLDGYCAGEPWGSLAVREGEGWCPTWSAALAPGHVEKVLMVREAFVSDRPAEHRAMIAALAAASAWCDRPENRPSLAVLLAQPRYIGLPVGVLLPALTGRFACGHRREEQVPNFHVFHRGGANRPRPADAANLQGELVSAGLVPHFAATADLPHRLFREDLFREALTHSDILSHATDRCTLPDGIPTPA